MTGTMLRAAAGVAFVSVCVLAARAEPPKLPVPAVDQSAVAQRGYFYVGGKYTGEPGKEIMQGQTYVEVLAPKDVRQPYPLVLIHGAAQTATNWMGTPDGRKGWAEYFVEQGYVVYMIDQPMRGRSAWHPAMARPACSRRRTKSFSSPRSRPPATGRKPRSTRNGRVTAPIKGARATRSSMRSTRRRSRRRSRMRRPNT